MKYELLVAVIQYVCQSSYHLFDKIRSLQVHFTFFPYVYRSGDNDDEILDLKARDRVRKKTQITI